MIINSVQTETVVSNTYCFDTYGNMVTGWVNTPNSKWYFFENAKTSKEGSMLTGWKEIQGSWYFFATNGVLLVNTITLDGYLVDIDGKWIK